MPAVRVLAVVLLLPVLAAANVGPPSSGGRVAGEPAGIPDITIDRETLTLDLRPLAGNGPVHVEAVYHLNNPGPERTLDLLFAAGSDVAGFRVWLNDQPLPSQPAPTGALPPAWKAPDSTPVIPGRGGSGPLMYRPQGPTPMAFTATIPPGRHTLRAAYDGEAGTHQYGDPTVYRQFGYVLAPARSWAGFGGLEVTVHLPPGWPAASSPELTRDGDTLAGRFDDIPADALTLTVQAPEGPLYRPVQVGSITLLALVWGGGLIVCAWAGRRRGRRGIGYGWVWALGWAAGWALVTLAAGMLALAGPDWALPADQASHYGYGQAFAVLGLIGLAALTLPIGFAAGLVAQWRASLRGRPLLVDGRIGDR